MYGLDLKTNTKDRLRSILQPRSVCAHIDGGIVYPEPYAPYPGGVKMLPAKKRRHLLGSIFWGRLGAFSSQLSSGLNRMQLGLGSGLKVAQERRFTRRIRLANRWKRSRLGSHPCIIANSTCQLQVRKKQKDRK